MFRYPSSSGLRLVSPHFFRGFLSFSFIIIAFIVVTTSSEKRSENPFSKYGDDRSFFRELKVVNEPKVLTAKVNTPITHENFQADVIRNDCTLTGGVASHCTSMGAAKAHFIRSQLDSLIGPGKKRSPSRFSASRLRLSGRPDDRISDKKALYPKLEDRKLYKSILGDGDSPRTQRQVLRNYDDGKEKNPLPKPHLRFFQKRQEERGVKEFNDLRRRCIQVTGGACKTMEAYNMAKLQQSAMPMDWNRRRDIGASDAIEDFDGAKALLLFLRPNQREKPGKKPDLR